MKIKWACKLRQEDLAQGTFPRQTQCLAGCLNDILRPSLKSIPVQTKLFKSVKYISLC